MSGIFDDIAGADVKGVSPNCKNFSDRYQGAIAYRWEGDMSNYGPASRMMANQDNHRGHQPGEAQKSE